MEASSRQPAPDRPRAAPSRGAGSKSAQVRLTLQVPPEVMAELRRLGKTPVEEVARVLKASLLKLTPRTSPKEKGTLPAEVEYLADLLGLPMEVLSLDEQLFVILTTAHEALANETTSGPEKIQQEVGQATADIADWARVAEQIVRRTRGIDRAEEAA